MRKIAAVLALLLAALLPGALAGDAPIRVVTTAFPVYDWTRQIVGDAGRAELVFLLEDGVDMHSWQPSAKDMMTIAGCDLFIFVGGESDAWVEEFLAGSGQGVRALSLLDALGDQALAEELREGMQAEPDGEEGARDEHIWLSVRNARILTGAIRDALTEADPAGAEAYAENAEKYLAALEALDGEYRAMAEGAPRRTLLFADRFPFRYLMEEYGLSYFAAFPGCSAEAEASFETLLFLVNKVDELELPAILTIETGDGRLAASVRDNSRAKDQEILTLNSMQSVTGAQAAAGVTWLSLMEEDLEVLRRALYG